MSAPALTPAPTAGTAVPARPHATPARLAAAWLRSAPGRWVAVTLAIALGAGFVAATLTFSATFRAALAAGLTAPYRHADVVVTPSGDVPDGALLTRIRQAAGVTAAEPLADVPVRWVGDRAHGTVELTALPADPALRWTELGAGGWPATADQLVLSTAEARRSGLAVGSRLTLTGPAVGGGQVPATVVGLVDVPGSATPGADGDAFGTPELLARVHQGPVTASAVLVRGSGDPGELAARVRDAVGGAGTVSTAAEESARALHRLEDRTLALTTVLSGFAAVAVLVSGMVIATTWTILVAQRRRQIALLRCVGASAEQVRRQVLAEAAVLGSVGALLGTAAGAGTGYLAAVLTGLAGDGPVLEPLPLAATVAGGALVTVAAAWLPAAGAMRIPPLAALRPADTPSATPPATRRLLRPVVATLLLAAGVPLADGARGDGLPVALAGGAAAAVAVLLLAPTVVPPLLRVVGVLCRGLGVPGRLAVHNLGRNPGRSSTTAAALMVGVGVIVTLQVGAATAEASLGGALSAHFPVDLTVDAGGDPLDRDRPAGADGAPGGLAAAVAEVPGTADVLELAGARGTVTGGATVTVLGLPADRGPATVRPRSPGEVVVPRWLDGQEATDGRRITVQVGDRRAELTTRVAPIDAAGVSGAADTVVVDVAVLRRLAPAALPLAVWASVPDAGDAEAVTARLTELLGADTARQLGGSVTERAQLQHVLGQLVTFATALLAVAVLIALVGVGNTVSLSVLERTRETALLRALGMQRGQVRRMLAVEAAALSVAGALVGVLAGLGLGWAGAAAALGASQDGLVLSVPWWQLAAVLAAAAAAAVLSSVLPGAALAE
ncbi:FtsX-like permease family protein [Nakamurella endophytica]|uniref:ABC3 transporter permease C-terminal domain-containing protein n=1 Tax=Nakamurella endophytica TaxID=1748367 RepID=A0A917SYL8_9ACTN|nr:FtsX-like permease family protein [Nakamurella endophytica]GGM02793.1 hypothetical protein GCM10011594_23620 [Nakamurella endophytica]